MNPSHPAAGEQTTSISPTMPAPVSFWQAFAFWLKLGFVSFGGPAGQIALMHQELVENRRWISEHRYLHAQAGATAQSLEAAGYDGAYTFEGPHDPFLPLVLAAPKGERAVPLARSAPLAQPRAGAGHAIAGVPIAGP